MNARINLPGMRIRQLRHIAIATLAITLAAACSGEGSRSSATSAALLTPDPAALAAPAPDSFTVLLATSEGEVEIRVRRAWAPLGADRVHYLAANGFFDGDRFFRVLPGFVAQFGVKGVPAVDAAFEPLTLADEPVKTANRRGTLTFAKTSQPNTRATQLFINLADNTNLDAMGFAPVGEVIRGMEVLERLYSGYGEGAPYGPGPDQGMIMRDGNRYLRMNFPLLDSIATAVVRP
jgi:peptidyl-prolyl cis-trans isomerase A (cyclophilin A)